MIENRSPFTNRKGPNGKPYGELLPPDLDISFVSAGRPSADNVLFDSDIVGANSRISFSELENPGYDSYNLGRKSVDVISANDMSYSTFDSPRTSLSNNVRTKFLTLLNAFLQFHS